MSSCMRTIVVWKRDLPPPALGLGGRALRENHSGMETTELSSGAAICAVSVA